MDEFNIRIEMLSRFKSRQRAKEIVERLKKVDIVIGTMINPGGY